MATTELEQSLTGPGGPFEIAEVEIRGVPTRVWKAAPGSLRDIWDASRAHAARDFLVYEDERYTYARSHVLVANLARRLTEQYRVGRGDRVAIAMRNYPEWALSFWAVVSIGAVAVPLNAWWTGPELAYGLSDSGAKLLIADGERLDRLAGDLDGLGLAGVVGVRTGALPAGGVDFGDLIGEPDEDASLPEVAIDPDDDVTILYTSGTTGRPKGAVGTHRNITNFLMAGFYLGTVRAAAAAGVPAAGAGGEAPPPPRTLLTFPLFHVGGLQSHLIPYTAYGGTLVLMYRWDADLAVDLIEREAVTNFSGVPHTAFDLLERAAARGASLDSLQGLASGATLVPPELVRRVDAQFSSRVAPGNGYGLTETTGAMVVNMGTDYVARSDSVGKPLAPVVDVRFVGPDGADAAPGEVGEIWISGPTIVRGYHNNPEATAAAFTDGWFHTGDLGYVDGDGFVHVVDRLKDVVIRGGENVYAAEVEAVLFEHPDISDAAVVGVPHPSLGEEVAAVLRRRPGSDLDADMVKRHVAGRLAAFKVPAVVEIRDSDLPRNASGKVLKRQLRDELGAAAARSQR
ncbi:MAG TPA: class I adenylate-forming enzyme family protein [Acidimicrobiales bacterium]|nr:class I adenylate-forming enzyme family protein [Acidimicrobiales bacterium]